MRTGRRGYWWAAVPQTRWPDDPDWRASMPPYLDPFWGDRRQQVVFIGADAMGETPIRHSLDACLLPANAFTPERWTALPDPFPLWEAA